MANDEVTYFIDAVEEIASNFKEMQKEYSYISRKNEFVHHSQEGYPVEKKFIADSFSLD
jgi:hypothetical protein